MPELTLSMTVIWIIAIVALLIVEGLTAGLVTIWFAIGAVAALICQMLGAPLYKIWGYNPAKAGPTSFTIGIDTPEVVILYHRTYALL